MITYLPGTTIEADITRNDTEFILKSMFSMGGLVLSQVSRLSGVEMHDVQNWVKRGFVSPPVRKQYSKRQFCRIILINMLRDCLPIADITRLLSYINGKLNDEDDDMISDDELYVYFVRVLAHMRSQEYESINEAVSAAIKEYQEPFAGAAIRLEKVLTVMAFSYCSTHYHRLAVNVLSTFDKQN
ncbi:MAG: DUF1836 domain-containing protein [Clostridia bacterium]|nr:DUF1836 domain-containing protein [Clostridia bacterium]